MLEKLKNARGITLIALVITIIVTLILIAVSIQIVLKEDGLFDQTSGAVVLSEITRNGRRS